MRKAITKPQTPSKTILISEQKTNINKISTNIEIASTQGDTNETRFTRKTNRYQSLRNQHRNYKEYHMMELLVTLFERRKRYSFQMVKLVYLFPDDTFSENISVNSYDRLFYQDEHIHTIVKIYETKQMEAKIWAFLNLKALHKRRKLQKFTAKLENVQQKLIFHTKKNTFDLLHQLSIKIHPQSTLKIERLQPINTRIEKNTIKIDQTSSKTQRIQRNTTNNINRIEKNQIIRVEQSYSPVVRRILLTPDDVKIIYPSTIRLASSREHSETNRVHHSPICVEKISERQQTTNIKTVVEENKKIYENPTTTIYANQTIKRIQPVQIRTVPSQFYQSQYEIKQNHSSRIRGLGYEYLVHTVHGDCTINIYNGREDEKKKEKNIEIQTNKTQSHSSPSIKVRHQGHSNPSCFYRNSRQMCRINSRGCCPGFNCCSFGHCCSGHGLGDAYCIEERILYLKRLEELCSLDKANKKSNKQ